MNNFHIVSHEKHLLRQVFLFVGIISLYIVITFPALNGGFILDDYPNLESLTQVIQLGNVWSYTFSGIASSLGRPLSYLTFALQAEDWPLNPKAFKIINLIIHIINGVFVYILCRLIAVNVGLSQANKALISTMSAAVWLFLPINISTTYYVVQRMTLLSASFTLLGVITFVVGYQLSIKYRWRGLLLASLGIAIGYVGGILSKETGILLCVFVPLLYMVVLKKNEGNQKVWCVWLILTCLAPALVLIGYLYFSGEYARGYGIRNFSMTERLMTEVIILWDYLKNCFWATSKSLNIYNDDYTVYRDLWWKPAVAVLAWLLLISTVIAGRKKIPGLTFAVMWFLGGHLLESTWLGLELYFEHRNYVPSIGLIIGSVWAVINIKDVLKNHKSYRVVKGLFSVIFLSWLVTQLIVLRSESEIWGDSRLFALSSVADRPDSIRAWQEAASYFANHREYAISAGILYQIEQRWPGYPGTLANQLLLQCFDNKVVVPPKNVVLIRMDSGKFDRSVVPAMEQILNVKKQGGCESLDWGYYRDILDSLLSDKALRGVNRENAIILTALSFNAEMNFINAAETLDRIDESKVDLPFLMLKARFYAMAGLSMDALDILNRAEAKYESNPVVWMMNKSQVGKLKESILNKIE